MAPRYRGAGAVYSEQGEQTIARLGYRIAGFSLNADDGGTLGAASVARRLREVRRGDIVIAHLNRPGSGMAEGLADVLGRELMRAAEAEALRRGCTHAWVDTQFGGRGFYERLGYTVFGELTDYPPGYTRTFLKKSLR